MHIWCYALSDPIHAVTDMARLEFVSGKPEGSHLYPLDAAKLNMGVWLKAFALVTDSKLISTPNPLIQLKWTLCLSANVRFGRWHLENCSSCWAQLRLNSESASMWCQHWHHSKSQQKECLSLYGCKNMLVNCCKYSVGVNECVTECLWTASYNSLACHFIRSVAEISSWSKTALTR